MGWRAAVFMGVKSYEENRVQRTVEARQATQWMTPRYSATVVVVKNCPDSGLVVLALSSAVF